uniref:Uncharacterized protein n=1 Tax=Sphingobacterium sp. (strain 21) TaxID=743722 RepID=F4C2D9_SPHS2
MSKTETENKPDYQAQVKELEKQAKADAKALEKYKSSAANDAETIKSLQDQLSELSKGNDQISDLQKKINEQSADIEQKTSEIEALKERIKTLESDPVDSDAKVFKNKKLTVHHSVNIPGVGKCTKEQILKDEKIQEYLLSIQSSAVSLNK